MSSGTIEEMEAGSEPRQEALDLGTVLASGPAIQPFTKSLEHPEREVGCDVPYEVGGDKSHHVGEDRTW